jgi:hypothetical protein
VSDRQSLLRRLTGSVVGRRSLACLGAILAIAVAASGVIGLDGAAPSAAGALGSPATAALPGTPFGVAWDIPSTGLSSPSATSSAIALGGTDQPSTAGATPGGSSTAPQTRNKYLWPFAATSIWNMPIGSGAVYIPADLAPRTRQTLASDPDIVLMDPTAPLTPIEFNGTGWSGGNRCPGSSILARAPIPNGFTVPSDGQNDALAAVMPDGRTVIQGSPFARCGAGGPATVLDLAPQADLYGDGILGGHGGSGLSSLGGAIRLGELVPGGLIRHALSIDLYGATDLFPQGYRWPAIRQDGCAPACYGGKVPALQMGALLALPTGVSIDSLGLQTDPGRMLAWTLQNYGGYVVDDAARSAFSLGTDAGPSGSMVDQFQRVWGYPFQTSASTQSPWADDIRAIFSHLAVVANNGPNSIGGGGTPLQPLAPPIGN